MINPRETLRGPSDNAMEHRITGPVRPSRFGGDKEGENPAFSILSDPTGPALVPGDPAPQRWCVLIYNLFLL